MRWEMVLIDNENMGFVRIMDDLGRSSSAVVDPS